jgi:acyl carrier protein
VIDAATFERVKKVLAVVLPVKEEEITPTSHLVRDLGFTDQEMPLLVNLEAEFELDIPDDDAERHFGTIEGIVAYIAARKGDPS